MIKKSPDKRILRQPKLYNHKSCFLHGHVSTQWLLSGHVATQYMYYVVIMSTLCALSMQAVLLVPCPLGDS